MSPEGGRAASFLPWLLKENKKSLSAMTLGWAGYTVLSTAINWDGLKLKPEWAWIKANLGWLNILVPLLQAIVIGIVLVAMTSRSRAAARRAEGEAAKDVQDFLFWWQAAWYLWFFLYVALTFQQLFEFLEILGRTDAPVRKTARWVAGWVAGSMTLVHVGVFYRCFSILERPRHPRNRPPFYLGVALPIVLVAVTFMIDLLIRIDSSLTPPFFFSDPMLLDKPVLLASGLTIILLFSRFDGEPFFAPFWVLLVLYLYGMIQPLIALAGRGSVLFVLGITVALAMKLLAYYLVAWAEDSRRLHRYYRAS
jgi:hypothetical protein